MAVIDSPSLQSNEIVNRKGVHTDIIHTITNTNNDKQQR